MNGEKQMKRNMVYGIIGIRVRMAMWNASFSKTANQTSLGEIFGSPQALGYAIKEQLNRDGYKVLYRRRLNEDGVMSLQDSFEYLTGEDNKTLNTESKLKKVLFDNFEDIIHFGTVFAAPKYRSFGICGAVQIGVGANKYADTEHVVTEVLSCFSAENAKKEAKAKKGETDADKTTAKSNTLGEKIVLDKAHYLYDVTINPFQYEEMTNEIEGFEGYKEEHYQSFKKASLKAVSNLNSKAKKGCTNEFALYVETKDEIRDSIDLNCLGEYVSVYEEDGLTVYNLEKVASLLGDVKEDLKSVEVYYDNRLIKLVGNIEDAKYFNIKTRKEL